jgi:ribosomal protein L4
MDETTTFQAATFAADGTKRESAALPTTLFDGTVNMPVMHQAVKAYLANQRQMRQLARKSALNARARENAVFVIETLSFDAPSTKRLSQLLATLGVADKKVLILTDGVKPNVYLSGRNYTTAHVMNYADASTYEILWSDVVLIEAGALGRQSDQTTEV